MFRARLILAFCITSTAACSALTSFDNLSSSAGDSGAADASDAGPSMGLDATASIDASSEAGGGADAGLSKYAAAILADHPMLFVRFDDGDAGPALDRSASNLMGTYGSGVVRGVPGLITEPNAAASFPGLDGGGGVSGVVTFAPSPLLEPTKQAVSVEAWMRSDVAPFGEIVSYGQDQAMPFQPWVLQVNTAHHLEMYLAAGRIVSGTQTLLASTTYFLVAVYDGSAITLYVNGTLDGTASVAAGALTNYGPGGLGLGGDFTGAIPIEGIVDEAAAYPYALTAAQVTNHYLAGIAK